MVLTVVESGVTGALEGVLWRTVFVAAESVAALFLPADWLVNQPC